jgi:hypothetical protein
MSSLEVTDPLLKEWLTRLFSVPEDRFLGPETYGDLLTLPFHQSRAGIGSFLRPSVDPYRGAQGVQWKAHAGNPGGIDLLRCEYDADGLRLTLTESNNFLLVRAMKQGEEFSTARDRRQYLQEIVREAVNCDAFDHRWSFKIPGDVGAERATQLIPNAGSPPLVSAIQTRHDRADILIHEGKVYLVFYKKIAQLEDFLPPDQWFSAEARAAIRAGLKG